MMLTPSRIDRIRRALQQEQLCKALQLAVSASQLGKDKAIIERGWAACQRPEFYRQIGKDPDALIRKGADALRKRFMTQGDA